MKLKVKKVVEVEVALPIVIKTKSSVWYLITENEVIRVSTDSIDVITPKDANYSSVINYVTKGDFDHSNDVAEFHNYVDVVTREIGRKITNAIESQLISKMKAA
jgi:hypothetical protein